MRPEVPFIFVTGTLGEEVAIEALKIGATDYVLKTRLSRLVPSVLRALREAKERTERKQTEKALRRSEAYLAEAQRLSRTGSFGWNVSTAEHTWSDETYRILGITEGPPSPLSWYCSEFTRKIGSASGKSSIVPRTGGPASISNIAC